MPSLASHARGTSHAAIALFTISLLSAGACASSGGPYIWSDMYAPASTQGDEYVAAPGDVLNVQVWDDQRISTKARVRSDGLISVPLLNDVPAVGRTPTQIARDLEQRLRTAKLVLMPRVTVSVDEARPAAVAVLGAVMRVGTFPLDANAGVAEALASAGGLTEFAHRDRIYVLRRSPALIRIRFTFRSLTDQSSRAALFRLRPGDVVVAE